MHLMEAILTYFGQLIVVIQATLFATHAELTDKRVVSAITPIMT